MFYSHEVLTSRTYGVATVWLVATLGSRSNLKKVTRKAILDVDVQKACETIVTPEAPMALRLQSNLLYGVARVYSQQCGYMLTDVQAARNAMRALVKTVRANGIDEEGHKGRADQLVLQDDPNFLPDLEVVAMDIDQLDRDGTGTEDSQRSAFSLDSAQRAGSLIDLPQDVGSLVIPQSVSSFIGGPLDGFGGLTARGSARREVDEGVLLDDDLGLVVGADGALLDEMPTRQPTAIPVSGERTDMSFASMTDGMPQPEGQQAGDFLGQPDEDGFMPFQDDYDFISDTHAVQPQANRDQPETSEETAAVRMRRRANATHKVIPLDTAMELHNSDLARWHKEYLANMEAVLRNKDAGRAVTLAKKNAEFWMLGRGNMGPLSMFQGTRLIEALTGIDLSGSGQKRQRDEGYETDENRRKRSRGEGPLSDQIARGYADDDGYMPMEGDDTIEQGREAPTPLDDRHLSSLMPWNQSAGSRRPTALFSGTGQQPTSASMGTGGLQLTFPARRGSRLTSASPLQGRGAAQSADQVDDFQFAGSQGAITPSGADDFEMYGLAANVDTQTAAQTQWQRAALDGETVNFLDFLKAGIEEMDQARADASLADEGAGEPQGTIDFEILLPPQSNTCVVAAQALLHVLSLETRSLLAVEQAEAFGAIALRPIAAI